MYVFAYQCLVLHLALTFSVQQIAPAHWETQQAVLIQHPPRFLLPLAKISVNYHKSDLEVQHSLLDVDSS